MLFTELAFDSGSFVLAIIHYCVHCVHDGPYVPLFAVGERMTTRTGQQPVQLAVHWNLWRVF